MAKKEVKKKADKKSTIDKILVSYLLGILSVVFAFFQPVAAIILGIVGLVQVKGQGKNNSAKTAKKLNIIGIVLAVIVIIISLAVYAYTVANYGSLQNLQELQ